jgi:hypothetical protein
MPLPSNAHRAQSGQRRRSWWGGDGVGYARALDKVILVLDPAFRIRRPNLRAKKID